MAIGGPQRLGQRGVIGKYFAALEHAQLAPWVDDISVKFDSDQELETYEFLLTPPPMREWKGPRTPQDLLEASFTIRNVHYETSVDIPVAWLRRDKTGRIDIRIQELAQRGVQHWEELLTDLIINGNSTTCYDGQYFFDSDHSEGDSGTQVNLITATQVSSLNVTTAASPTAAEMMAAILDVIAYMMKYKDDHGEPINEDARGWLIMCPATKIWTSALAAVHNDVINQSTNTLKNSEFNLKVVANPRLTWTTDFAVFRTDAPVKPLIRQEETHLEVKMKGEGSDYEFNQAAWSVGVDAWRAVGYGRWQYAARCTLS